MFSGSGGSRNYRIGWWRRGGGGGPSLTDILVVLYLLFTECSIDHSKETKFRRREGESKFLGAVGVGVGMGCGGPKETYFTFIFPGGGGVRIFRPPPL